MAGHEGRLTRRGEGGPARRIRRTIGSARRVEATATADVLKQMLALCPDTLAGMRNSALLALGFAGAFRRVNSARWGSPTWLRRRTDFHPGS